MKLVEVVEVVTSEVKKCIRDQNVPVVLETPLIGKDGALDSILLIELCVGLEDRSSELGFEFDWTSDAAMSQSRSMFATVESLAQEFYNQMLASK
jgi:acyl carrier protein